MTYRDRTQDSTVSTGTGTLSLTGTAPAGLRTFSEVFSVNQAGIDYCIFDSTAWEIGRGTFLIGNTFSRDTVLSSSNANAAVSFSAGTKTLMHILSAAALVDLQANRPQNAASISSGVTLATDTVALVVGGALKVMTVENFIALVSTAAGRAILTAADAPAQRTALGLGTAATQSSAAFDAAGAAAAAQAASQPVDADLTAIAALTTTTFGRALLTAADAAATRSAIGAGTSDLAIGTTSVTAKVGDYQPAAVNISDSTAAGRAILTAADAPAQRTALGLGTAATTAASDYATAAQGATANTALQPGSVHAATLRTTMADADELAGQDSAASFSLFRITWTNVKVFLKTYFDTLYPAKGATTSSGLTMATARLLGRTTASTGAVEEITVGSGLSLSAGALTCTVSGTVTHTAGALTSNALVLGAGGDDTKVPTGLTSDGASQLNLGVNATTAGKIKIYGPTSGDATIKTAAAAGTAVQITLPAVDSTLATLGSNTLTGAQIVPAGSPSATSINFGTAGTGIYSAAAGSIVSLASGGSEIFRISGGNQTSCFSDFIIPSNTNKIMLGSSNDVILVRGGAAATLQHGALDAASPVGQTLQVQSVSTGTSNTNGAPWTFNGSKSTGTGVGGDTVFKNSPAGSSGSSQNATTERFRIHSAAGVGITVTGTATFTSNVTVAANGLTTTPVPVATLPSAAAYSGTRIYVNDATMTILTGNGTTVVGGGANTVPVGSNGANWIIGG